MYAWCVVYLKHGRQPLSQHHTALSSFQLSSVNNNSISLIWKVSYFPIFESKNKNNNKQATQTIKPTTIAMMLFMIWIAFKYIHTGGYGCVVSILRGSRFIDFCVWPRGAIILRYVFICVIHVIVVVVYPFQIKFYCQCVIDVFSIWKIDIATAFTHTKK